jgi:iron complex transport system substrate-binding protein
VNVRIASLLPAATEIVCALGRRDGLVGVSHECDFPEGVGSLAILTRARLSPLKTSREIDHDVRDLLQNALAIYEIELDRLEAARPDVVVTQDLCDVCAVSIDDVRAAVLRLARKDVRVVNLHPTCLADIWGDIRRVADAIGVHAAGEHVVAALEARVSVIAARAAALVERPRVLTIEWIDPVMVGGLWMPELVELAGGVPLVTSAGEHAPTLSRDALARLAPDVVVVKPCGFSLSRTIAETAALRSAMPWDDWTRERTVRVYLADGNAYFNRPGPRIVESLEILAACTHPDAFADFWRAHAGSVIPVDPALHRQG